MPESFTFGEEAVRQIAKVVRRVLNSEFFKNQKQYPEIPRDGEIKLAKIQAACNKGTNCQIKFQTRNNTSPGVNPTAKGTETNVSSDPLENIQAYNRLANIPIANPWVYVAFIDGGWEIISADPCE